MLLPRLWLTREGFLLRHSLRVHQCSHCRVSHWSRWIKIFDTNIYRHIAHCLSQRLMQWLCDFCIAAIWYQSLIGKRQTMGLLVKVRYHTYDSCLALINSWKSQLKTKKKLRAGCWNSRELNPLQKQSKFETYWCK
jgi:hypothetical protein